MATGDVDGDGDIDIVEGGTNSPNKLWLNQGGIQGGTEGQFADSGQLLQTDFSQTTTGVALGDVDGDGDLDAGFANVGDFFGQFNQHTSIWLNDGNGNFSDSGQRLPHSHRIEFGDLDSDGDLDIVTGHNGLGGRVLHNDHAAHGTHGGVNFTSVQTLVGSSDGMLGVSLGDLDDDGDLDVFTSSYFRPIRVWKNNGSGIMSLHQTVEPSLGHRHRGNDLADIDNDGDLDAVVAKGGGSGQPAELWVNDGNGNFSASSEALGTFNGMTPIFGDFNGDHGVDIFLATHNSPGSGANQVFFNDNPPPSETVTGLDTTFGGGDGKVTTDFAGGSDGAFSVTTDASGNIILAGWADEGASGGYNFALARYTPGGVLDITFGTGGKVTTDFAGADEYGHSVALDGSGNIIVAGYTDEGASGGINFAVARYTSSGALDTTFGGGDGFVTTDFAGDRDVINSMAVDGSGNIIVAGIAGPDTVGIPPRDDFALARYTPDGILDTTFGGGDGKVTTDFVGSTDRAYAMTLDGSGKILAAGLAWENSSGGGNFGLARYNADGSLDTTFGEGDGKVTLDINSGSNDAALGVTVDGSGKILVSGSHQNENFVLLRYTPDGVLDTTFGASGKVITDFAGNEDVARSVQVTDSGNIMVAGYADEGASGGFNFAVARYTPAGALDSSFGTGGKITTDFAGNNDYAYSMALDGSGNLFVAGSADQSGNRNFALAKYVAPPTTEVAVDGSGNLMITDIAGGNTNDHLVVTTDGVQLTVSDLTGGKILLSGLNGTGDRTSSVTFALSEFSGGVIIDTLGGTDTVNLDAALNISGAGGITVTAEQINVGGGTLTTNGGAVALNGKVALTADLTIDTNSDDTGAGGAVTLNTGNVATPTLYGNDDGDANLTLTIDTSSANAAAGNVNLGRVWNNDGANSGDEFLGKLVIDAGGASDGVITLTPLHYIVGVGYQNISVDGVGAAGGVELVGTVAGDGNTVIDTNQTAGRDAGFLDLDQALMTQKRGGGNFNLDASATGAGQGGDVWLGDFADAGGGFQRPEGIGVYATDEAGPTGSITFTDGNGDGVGTINFDGGGASFYASTLTIAPGVHVAVDALNGTPFPFPGIVQFTDVANTWNTTLNGSGAGDEQLTINTAGIGLRFNSVVRLPTIGDSVPLGGISVNAFSGYPIELHGDIMTSPGGAAALVGAVNLTGDVKLMPGSTQSLAIDGSAGANAIGGHEQFDVNGTVDLGGAGLDIQLGFVPAHRDTFVLIDNDGADAVTGTFAGLAEGSIFTVNALGASRYFEISYTGGDGNDVELSALEIDFDDAPASYGEASHVKEGPQLGANRDGESVGSDTPNADGDDLDGVPDDEDGVTFIGVILADQTGARVEVEAPTGGQLDAWIDFDGDGTFSGIGEQIFNNLTLISGTNLLTFNVPAGATVGDHIARFRVSSAGGLNAFGAVPASDGEVEDHVLTISPTNSVSIDSEGNLSISGDGDEDTITFTVDGGNLRIHTVDDSLNAGGGTSGDANGDVLVPLAGLNSLSLNSGIANDVINLSNLTGFTGALDIDGGDGQDKITFKADATLGADNDAKLTAEEVDFVHADITTTGTGSITIDANGGSGATKGIDLLGTNLNASGTGSISLNGEGGDSGSNTQGVQLHSSTVSTNDGDVDIDGVSTGTTSANQGVAVYVASSISAGGSGNLTIDGTSSTAGTSSNHGVYFTAGSSASVENGDLNITGTGAGNVGINSGAYLGGNLTSTGTGNITVVGTSSGSGFLNVGINASNARIDTTAGSGSVTLSGTGSTSGATGNDGVRLINFDIATGGNGGIDIDGIGGGTTSNNNGVALLTGSTLAATGSGTVTIDGTGGSGTSSNRGVYVTGAGNSITSVNGNLSITGTANGTTLFNRGIELGSTTVSSTGIGAVTLTGTGSLSGGASGMFNQGIYLLSSNVNATTGALSITGNGGKGAHYNEGVRIQSSSVTSASGATNITGIANAGTTGVANSGVYLLSTTINGGGGSTIMGTGGGGTGTNHGISAIGLTSNLGGGAFIGDNGIGVTSQDLYGNFFPAP